ncbi:glycosyltransferase [Kaistia defluvii]|uniref:glycosyltransferase n=1 Tax=Kaistia defluvii TaxID=410841 RepID=UPI0022580321|nr:glycosyltransferase [Kaistia defluvii]MCX5519506.1 glycosyltransferase [Kaistia defluvii]
MIPTIIHQTWRDRNIPPSLQGYVASWPRLHPGWEIRLWTDDDLALLVRQEYPHLAEQYFGYPRAIQRADLGRYLVLHHQGGVYADLDAEALRSFDVLLQQDRPLFAEEPRSHLAEKPAIVRGLTARIVSNAVMVSPARHPFWDVAIDLAVLCRHALDPLDATGPFLLTGAVDATSVRIRPDVIPGYMFSPKDKYGRPCADRNDAVPALAQHHWCHSWIPEEQPLSRSVRIKTALRKVRLRWRERGTESPALREDAVDRVALARHAPANGSVLIAIPVRDAASTLDALFARILALDFPPERLAIAFLVGNSSDDSLALIQAFLERHRSRFSRTTLLEHDFPMSGQGPRWSLSLQRKRRSRIARARNLLLREGLLAEDWVLWIDADIIDFPKDVLKRMLAERARVVHPDSVREKDGRSFDQNAWISVREPEDHQWIKHVHDGLYQPPAHHLRLYMHDLRYLPRVRLDSVGGTMLLVDANIHRAGIVFPDTPYRRLIETEAFAALARHHGVELVGLPQLQTRHADH